MGIRKKKTLAESANDLAESIGPALENAVENAKEKALPLLEDAKETVGPILTEGRELAAEKASEAKDALGPIIAEGRELAAEKASEAREKAGPLLAEGRALAAEKVAEGKVAAEAAVNELRGIEDEPEPKKGGKLKKLLFFGVLVGIGGVIFKKLRGSDSGDNWQSSYVPAPPPAPRAAAPADTAGSGDSSAASPDEALADAADAPHADTTPDAPAEVVQIDTPEGPYGAGSAAPLEDGSAPDASFVVKGNGGSMLFHTEESPSFERTKAEVWFIDAAAAEAAGFKPWDHKARGGSED